MCVIALCDIERPKEEAVTAMYKANDCGAGIAWREKDLVKWRKGLTLDEIQDMIAKVPLPFCAHFRIPSYGGNMKALCHPFPITEEVDLALEGERKGPVLFHNGHWTEWRKTCFEVTLSRSKNGKAIRPPSGAKWSDSRAMAWLASLYGTGFLAFLDEKIVVFGPGPLYGTPGSGANIDIFGATGDKGWKRIDNVWCSNDFWEHRMIKHYTYPRKNDDKKEADTAREAKDITYITPPASLMSPSFKNPSDARDQEKDPVKTVLDAEVVKPELRGAQSQNPFLGLSNKKIVQLFKTIEEAEDAYKEKKISKKALKRCRRMLPKAPKELVVKGS